MRLYLAGLFTNGFANDSGKLARSINEAENASRVAVPWYLESYHYVHSQRKVDDIRRSGKKVFLDSGAFSAFTMGAQVDLPGYCRYIKENEDIIDVASVLDGIGDPLKTYQNQMAMEALGTKPLPCFHYGEDIRYLEYYVANYEYITLGGMVPISTRQLYFWLDEIWEKYLTDGSGRPKVKVHGFGLTTIPLMRRYPWFSVDSSSWVQISSNGNILLADNWKALAISDQSPARKVQNQHYDSMTEPLQAAIRKIIERDGYDVERLRTLYLSRWAYCCHSFNLLGEEINDGKLNTFFQDQMGLF
jgi:hypothetical protein